MRIGYIRKSRDKQETILQEDALRAANCEKIFTESASGAKEDRVQLREMLVFARPGDVIVIWKLDRLGRSLKHLIEVANQLNERGIDLISLQESFDTTTPMGKFIFYVIGAFAEFERNIIRERTMAGLDAARARGRKGGRPKATSKVDPKKLNRARELYDKKEMTVPEIMALLGFKSKATFYKYVVNVEVK